MASAHVVVIDASARRATVKTTPNKHLSDILDEACARLGLKAGNYGLKNNNRQVDLSRTFRLSGLSPGAKLELVLLSKSAGVVSVALQLAPADPDSAGVPNGRLTDKFPSNTTLWQLLRRFEEGVAGGAPKRNLTQRALPSADKGAGRLFYQQPVLNIMNREISSLPDLNKNLAQLGYNSGSVLIRLAFKPTDTPLEDAATHIARYFLALEQDEKPAEGAAEPTHLTQSSRNKRLPTEAEIAAVAEAKREELQAIKDVEIRIRFPDQSQVTSTFTQLDSGSSLYSEIRDRMLDPRFRHEPFTLKDPSVRRKGDLLVIPDDESQKLIRDLGLKGRLLLVFAWTEAASVEARGATTVLRDELRRHAVDVKVDDLAATSAVDHHADTGVRVNVGNGQDDKDDAGGGSLGKKMPKWLKGLSKK
ncbi:hypothetical protein DV737_g2265, partial [Chaetothyriales sp. CBS 132003]